MRRQPGERLLLEMDESTKHGTFHFTVDSRGPHRDSHFEKTSESSSLLSWVLFNPLIYKSLSSQHFFPLTVTSSPSQGLTYHSILTCFHQFSEITL